MLVFRAGQWHSVNMPTYVDPAWGFGDRQKVASIMIREQAKGPSAAFAVGEAKVYEASLGNNMAPQRTKKNMPV